MKIKTPKWVFPSSFIFGWHFGKNPVNGQKFGCIGLGLFNIDIEYEDPPAKDQKPAIRIPKGKQIRDVDDYSGPMYDDSWKDKS